MFQTDNNKIICQTKAHSMPITYIECTVSSENNTTQNYINYDPKHILVLTVSKLDTKLFDLESLKLRHTLEYSENSLTVIHVSFLPKNNKIFTCFSDDTIHIWNQNTMAPIIQFSPFKHFNNPAIEKYSIENLKIYENNRTDNDMSYIQPYKFNENFPSGRIRSVCFSSSGENVCISTIDNLLVIIVIEDWQILKIIRSIDLQIKQINYITYCDLESVPDCSSGLHQPQQYLLIHAINGDCVLIDANNLNSKTIVNQHNSHKMCVNTRNSSIFGIILKSGEILIEKSDFYVSHLENYQRSLAYNQEKRRNNGVLMERVFKNVSIFIFRNFWH